MFLQGEDDYKSSSVAPPKECTLIISTFLLYSNLLLVQYHCITSKALLYQ